MRKKPQYDTLLFAVMLMAISGACLVYNIRTAENISSTPTFTEIVSTDPNHTSLISDSVAANLTQNDSIEASAVPHERDSGYELLPPIITPPAK